MISNNQRINSLTQVIKEPTTKECPRNTHSTDTEPEVEVYNNHHKPDFNDDKNSKDQIHLQNSFNRKAKNGFARLIDKLPEYEYEFTKKNRFNRNRQVENNLVPLDAQETDNNRFCDYFEAFLYIAQHCQKYNYRFTRDNCRQYLKKCYIIDFAHDEFIPILTHLSSRKFNKYFQNAQKELKYL